jgi:archaellum component FlaC
MEATVVERSSEAMGDKQVSLERIDERVEQLGKSMDQMNNRVGRFESQVNDRFGRVESGINQIQNQFQELQHTLVQMTWGLAAALLVILGSVITAQL